MYTIYIYYFGIKLSINNHNLIDEEKQFDLGILLRPRYHKERNMVQLTLPSHISYRLCKENSGL